MVTLKQQIINKGEKYADISLVFCSGRAFDMDGTMFDTERLRFQTLKQASQELLGRAFQMTT